MLGKEYLSVNEMSKECKTGTRNIRKTIDKLRAETSPDLLYKDKNHRWRLHHILIERFKPKNRVKGRYYALSVDLCRWYSESDIHTIMQFVCDNTDNPNLEINYTIESKKANNHSHLHCFINCEQKRKLIENLRVGFSSISFKENKIFDLAGWKSYITKDGSAITTIKK